MNPIPANQRRRIPWSQRCRCSPKNVKSTPSNALLIQPSKKLWRKKIRNWVPALHLQTPGQRITNAVPMWRASGNSANTVNEGKRRRSCHNAARWWINNRAALALANAPSQKRSTLSTAGETPSKKLGTSNSARLWLGSQRGGVTCRCSNRAQIVPKSAN